jgi:phage regulator Rha-like protein
MSDLSILSGAAVTMSSREIAELTGKDHAHVMRDTRNMLEVLKKDASSFGGIYQDAYGRDKPCFNLDSELNMTLVSGYDIPLRHRVVTKLAELEAQALRPPAALPDFTNPAAAARAWADAIEQKQAVEVEAQKMTHQLALVAPKAQQADGAMAGIETPMADGIDPGLM